MSFFDSPTVDDNAKKSEESVLKVKGIFTKRNGFINREENPDYGVDLDVELVLEAHHASSQKFAVQIKSTGKVSTVSKDGHKYISLSFETSRLGYLCRRPPAYGIIILYEEETQRCYFDYVDEIVNRVSYIKGNDDWKQQDSVTIYIPEQLLETSSSKALHDKMCRRHKSHELLLFSHGTTYDIPVISSFNQNILENIDFNSPQQVGELLEEYGGHLFNKQEFQMLSRLLMDLPTSKIIASKKLLFLAAITFGQVGYIIEADYYLNRCFNFIKDFDQETHELLEFTKYRNDFIKGDIDYKSFSKEMEVLRKNSINTLNTLTFEINIIYLQLLDQFNKQEPDHSVAEVIQKLFQKIENAPLEEHSKQLLKLFQSENLHIYGSNIFLKDANKFKLQEKLNISVSLNVRVERVKFVLPLFEKAIQYAHEVRIYAEEKDDSLVKAYSLQYLGRFFLDTQFNVMMLKIDQEYGEDQNHISQFLKNLNYSLIAYNLFLDLGLNKDAHQTLTNVYEIQMLCFLLYGKDIGPKKLHELESIIRDIEEKAGIPQFNSVVRPAYENLRRNLVQGNQPWTTIPEDEVEKYAWKILEAYELPENRLPNIIADIRNYQIFERECENKNIELLQDLRHLQSKSTTYAEPPKYILRSKLSNIETKPSRDIYHLLQQFSHLLKKK
ncbi:hypothetical protein GCM10011506_21940 [Marivirga lumbricoides]|uniref:DUF4365 domain-containing protein n=2 Tax=Marivirga lumbricoides TaxID=1046115 RepID=A0ABQ1M8A9_9BACT|nr:hypothetical protein GCM10011506_21940 [Marivirga lumbricoides]